MSDIIDTLNNDPKVQELMRTAQQAALKANYKYEEWQQFKKDVLIYLALLVCPEAMRKLSDEIYYKLKQQA